MNYLEMVLQTSYIKEVNIKGKKGGVCISTVPIRTKNICSSEYRPMRTLLSSFRFGEIRFGMIDA